MSAAVPPNPRVPVRTIAATIAMVLATVSTIWLLGQITRILTWFAVAGFFTVVLNPAVDFLNYRLRVRRTLATFLVFLAGLLAMAAMMYVFIRPLVDQATHFADSFPTYVADAKAGRGPVGRLVKRYELDQWVEENQDRLRESLQASGRPAADLAASLLSGFAAMVTILVLVFLMLLEAPKLTAGAQKLVPARHRERVSRVARDCGRAVTGYMGGNLLISIIAGLATYVMLWPLGVPFRGALALWVAFADLIPLVGATLGAVVVTGVAFLHTPRAGIIALVFFIVYQQFENHVLQVSIMSRTVDLNPLAVMVCILVGVELFGLLGALLAIPAGGVVQVVARDLYDENLGMLKGEPTIGADEVPLSQVKAEEGAAEGADRTGPGAAPAPAGAPGGPAVAAPPGAPSAGGADPRPAEPVGD